MDTSIQTSDVQLDSNTVTVAADDVSEHNETSNSEHITIATTEEPVRQVPSRKMIHSLKLSPLAMTATTAEMTRTHSDYQIYKAGVLLKPLNKRFQSDDTLNMDTGIALASSTPIQSLLSKRTTFVANSNTSPVANSNTSPVTNSNTSSTVSSNISNHIEDPGYSTIAKDQLSDHPTDPITDNSSNSNTIPVTKAMSDEDPGYSSIAEVFPGKDQPSDLSKVTTASIANNSNTAPVTDSVTSNHITDDSEDPGYSVIADGKDEPSDLPNITNNSITNNSSTVPVTNSNISNHIADDSEDPGYSVIAEVFPDGLHKDNLPSVNTAPVTNSNNSSTFIRNHIVDEEPGYSSIAEGRPVPLHNSNSPSVTSKQETQPAIVYAKVNKPLQTTVTNDTVTSSDTSVMYKSVEVVDVGALPTSVSNEPDNDPSLLYAKVNKSKQTTSESTGNTLHSKDGAKVTFADEADSNHLSHKVTLRHGSAVVANSLKVKSSSSQDLKDNVVDDPRRHSAMPASPQDYRTGSGKFEPTYDEDWRKVSSPDKLQVSSNSHYRHTSCNL